MYSSKELPLYKYQLYVYNANCHPMYQVNGGWGPWTDWSACTASCGGGEQTRTRDCNNPESQCGGTDCTLDGSSSTETQNCNENCCPGE